MLEGVTQTVSDNFHFLVSTKQIKPLMRYFKTIFEKITISYYITISIPKTNNIAKFAFDRI